MRRLARKTDPQTSHDAPRGNHRPHRLIVAGLLKSMPGSTYQELFRRHASNRRRHGNAPIIADAPSLMRRLPEVATRVGERRCRVTGNMASIWELRS